MPELDQYVTSYPSAQTAIDLFQGDWSSSLPEPFAHLQAGAIPLFGDARITWLRDQLGSIKGMNVLELGPLEAGHSYMLEQFGAASVTAIEANQRAFLKCLVVKEILQLNRVHFLCGDFVEYLRHDPPTFDLCVASGVLYHMRNPAELIALAAKVSNHLYLWTHYYDEEVIANTSNLAHRFSGVTESEYEGFKHTLHRQEYKEALDWSGFCGGSAPFSQWMTREGILDCCRYFGLTEIELQFDVRDHQNGPCFSLLARRPDSVRLVASGTATDNQALTATEPVSTFHYPAGAKNSQPARLKNLEQQVKALRRELKEAQAQIAAMETSKFWKLRTGWMRVKRSLGLKE
jgi:hypothetical protein